MEQVIRLIFVKVNSKDIATAEEVWNQRCAPLMIAQPGCLSEQLLKCVDSPGEFISYSEWKNQESIDEYLASEDHQKIKEHSKGLTVVEDVVVKRYSLVS